MTEEIISLSQTEIDRISVIRSIISGVCSCKIGLPYILYISRQLTQAPAAQQLNLSIFGLRDGSVDAEGYGGYAQAAWILTGEHRAYRRGLSTCFSD